MTESNNKMITNVLGNRVGKPKNTSQWRKKRKPNDKDKRDKDVSIMTKRDN